jgi:hypothetical protein
MNRALVLITLGLLVGGADVDPDPSPQVMPSPQAPSPEASPPQASSQSTCPETLPDVDRLACLVSAPPALAPNAQKPAPPMLRNPDGGVVIGPKVAQ